MDNVTIPKIIMQTWKTNDIPEGWKESPLSIKNYMSDWKYILMTDKMNEDFVKENFPGFYPYFIAFPYNIQRADAIRACWLYINGGLYIDLDMVIKKDLSEFFTSNQELYFVNSGNISGTITNSFMASKKGCNFWLEYIEEMKKPPNWAFEKHFIVMTTTGPMCLTKVLKKSIYSYTILPQKLIMPCSVCDINKCNSKDSYIKPLIGQSWNGWTSKTLNFAMCNWREVSSIILILLVILFFLLIYKK